MIYRHVRLGVVLAVALAGSALGQTGPSTRAGLEAGDKLVICGDSITEQREYSVLMEDYLLACQPAPGMTTAQSGWSGETVGRFVLRMPDQVLVYKPTAVTTCYGMNDGGYGPLKPEAAKMYREGTRQMVRDFRKAGVRWVVVGSPGCVDSATYQRNPANAAVYNKTLGELRDIARDVAKEENARFADVHAVMLDAMAKYKAKYGEGAPFAGRDGVHPGRNGHVAMAYAFLKALGCDGDIGTITVDLAKDTATATAGHKVLAVKGGTVEVESSRYPFCFYGDPKDPGATRATAELVSFDEELNRFRLVVANGTGKLKVTWGKASKEFPAETLAKGINLAAEFWDNPFAGEFAQVDAAVRQKQFFESYLMRDVLGAAPTQKALLPDVNEAVDKLIAAGMKKQANLAAAAREAVKPVRHTLIIEPVK